MLIRSSFSWDVKQCRLVVNYGPFRGTFFRGLNLEDRTNKLSRNSVPANLHDLTFQKRETQKGVTHSHTKIDIMMTKQQAIKEEVNEALKKNVCLVDVWRTVDSNVVRLDFTLDVAVH